MFETLEALWEIVVDVWDTGNRIAKLALVCILCWPLIPLIYALSGWNVLVVNALIGLIPAIAFLTIFITRLVDPLVLAVLASVKKGRQAVQLLFSIVAGESAIGLYFTLVPVANNRPMVPVLMLVAITLIFFMIGIQGKWVGKAKAVLILMVLGITGTFFYDWTGKVQALVMEPNELQEIPALFREGGHLENDLWINPQNKGVKKYAKRDNKVVRTGNVVELLYNCDRNMKIADIDPYQTVEIGHIMKRLDMENRCSYSYTGDAYPIFGAYGQVIQPKYLNDVPFPGLFPGNAVVFQLKSADGIPLVQDYVQHIGGRTTLVNDSDEKKELWVIYNYAHSFQGEETGWDGSTASFTIKIASQ